MAVGNASLFLDRIDNQERIQAFAKGTETLHSWIQISKERMAEAATSKAALEEKVQQLEAEIAAKREVIASMEVHPESDPDVVVVDDSSVKSRPERLYELYGKLGLNSLSSSDLKYLIVKSLYRGSDYNELVLNGLQEDLLEISEHASMNEEVEVSELREVIEMESPENENEALKKEQEELERLEKEKENAESELRQKGGNDFYGGNQEFYMMKGECYSHRVCSFIRIHCSLTNTNTRRVPMERRRRTAFPSEALSPLSIQTEHLSKTRAAICM